MLPPRSDHSPSPRNDHANPEHARRHREAAAQAIIPRVHAAIALRAQFSRRIRRGIERAQVQCSRESGGIARIGSAAHQIGAAQREQGYIEGAVAQRLIEHSPVEQGSGLAGAATANVKFLTLRHDTRVQREHTGEIVDREETERRSADRLNRLARQQVERRSR